MKGKAKLIKNDGVYRVFIKNHFWQRWKPLLYNGKQIEFKSFKEFGEMTQIEKFGEITISYKK